MAGAFAAFAQMVKPPVAALTLARIGQDDTAAQAPARVINFSNEEAITTSFVPAPTAGSTSGGGSTDNINWLKVEFHYSVNPADPQKYPWIDSAQFKIWIEGRDLYDPKAPGRDGVAVCLVGTVTYVNLQQARDAYGVFYVHPTALARYCGNGTSEDFDRKFDIHIIATVGGKPVDVYDKNKDYSDWQTKCVQVPNLVCRQDQSPFLMADSSRYPQIKLQGAESGSSQ